jgi:hypothetical protein
MLIPTQELHKHYVSITEMEYVKEDKTIQVSIQLTGHDLEYAINQLSQVRRELKPVCKDSYDSTLILTELYLSDRLNITIKDEVYSGKVIGIENNNDGNAYVYLVIPNVKKIKTFTIKNTLLMDHFENQQNITHLKYGKQKKTRTFTRDLRTHIIEF